MVYVSELKTPLGLATARIENGELTGFWFIGQKYYPTKIESWTQMPEHPIFTQVGDRKSVG
jgi:methylated-DNA-[protein]-cysteine S-methyltransferase